MSRASEFCPPRRGRATGATSHRAHIRDVVDVLSQTHDFVILDTPGTFNEIVAAAIEVGTMILLITTLDMASIKDTVLALEMLHERFGNDDERIKVVLNRAGMDTGVREKDVERDARHDALVEDPAGQRSHQGGPARTARSS